MQIYENRQDGGKKLIPHLLHYKQVKDTIVLALPRGGVVTGAMVANGLQLPLDIICPRKLGAPFNPELAIGAVTESGEGLLNRQLIKQLAIPSDYIEQIMKQEMEESKKRMKFYRQNKPPVELKGKTVILVDDGLATGATMKAAIHSVQKGGAAKVIVAVPVAPAETLNEIKQLVDEMICPLIPDAFYAVGQFYRDFSQTEDQEVMALLQE